MPTDYAVNHIEKNIIRRRTINEKKKNLSGDVTRSNINKAKFNKMPSCVS